MRSDKLKNNAANIKNKKVFLRADLNVPLEKGRIKDENKIIEALPTFRFLLRYGCSVIAATHIGRPKGRQKKYSTKPVAKRLNRMLGGRKLEYVNSITGKEAQKKAENLRPGRILFLENLRFEEGEEKNSARFAKDLARMADIYVNEAFSVCHRKHASVAAIKKYLPCFKGMLLSSEIENLNKIKQPKRPLVILMGGAKIKTKIKLIDKLEPKASKIMIGGALANNFLKAEKHEIGRSLSDKQSVRTAKRIKSKKILLPIDAIVKSQRGQVAAKNINNINKGDKILDIGPKTVKLFSYHLKKANTIVWNGPMGMFEDDLFKHGTLSLARSMAGRAKGPAFGVAGGGETVEALELAQVRKHLDWVSTGGGAMLSYLGGDKMPGLE